ncbi:MAG: thioredoxin domain-containing protein [Rhodospirillaceae bacterium]|nr:thioredoxin domain-containing protein [Rhodospirillaceae bacterium]
MFSVMHLKATCSIVWRLKRTFPALLVIVVLFAGNAEAGRLADSTSSYLASHAEDAIAWQPWDEQSLALAEANDKLIFLTLGYAACHWCHVLARTTLKDTRVIEALGQDYVSILVDREERPDLDSHFSDIMLAMTGQSGYPALFVLTPDGVPVFAAGYLAAEPEHGNPGLLEVLQGIAGMWRGQRGAILADAENNRDWLRDNAARDFSGTAADDMAEIRRDAARQWTRAFDPVYGGFGDQPKFLRPDVLMFLLDEGLQYGDRALLEKVYLSLDQMAAGGVRDQLGGAFHRYAVDRFWQVPHFEIMLNETAWMALLYLRAYQASARPHYATVARGVLDDLLRRFHLPDGSFAASLDAESSGREGLYYTWTEDEIRAVLGETRAAEFGAAYVDTAAGLVEGRSVLRLRAPIGEQSFAAERAQLLKARGERDAPKRDDKMLSAWNAVTLMAFAKASQVLADKTYLTIAQQILGVLMPAYPGIDGLVHSRRGERQSAALFLEDFAFLALALLHLYETDFQVTRLDAARTLMMAALDKFQAKSGKPFQVGTGEADISAQVSLAENGAPSANAAALEALHRLVLFGAGRIVETEAEAIGVNLRGYLQQNAVSATGLLRALDYIPGQAREIIIVGELAGDDTKALLREIRARALYGAVVAVISPEASRLDEDWPLLAARPLLANRATAYVCRNRVCKLPVDSAEELAAQLDAPQFQGTPGTAQ